MNTKKWTTVLAGLCAVVLWGLPADTEAGVLQRLGANTAAFGSEFASNVLPAAAGGGGTVIFTRSVLVPAGMHTLYLTLAGTVDVHTTRLELSANVNGVACSPNVASSNGAPGGWVLVQNIPQASCLGSGLAGDCHDNGVYYQWCCTIPVSSVPTIRNAQWKIASAVAGNSVFLEQASLYVDGTDGFGGQCGATAGGLTFSPQ